MSAIALILSSILSIGGVVVDGSSGVAVPGAHVAAIGTAATATTDARGRFVLRLAQGRYRLRVSRSGYQTTESAPVRLSRDDVAVTIPLSRTSAPIRTIATATVSRASSLLWPSTFVTEFNAESLTRTGVVRAADALREAPGVNNGITGDTGALGDDVNLSIRGIGTLETVATIDGHPIGYGIRGGYNYQLSPVFPYRDVRVLYGSGGSDVVGVNAIGGVVDFVTLDPSAEQSVSATQGFGTFERLASSLTATGESAHVGYALAYGSSGLDGPFRNANFYQPAASADVSAPPGSTAYENAVYPDDSSVASHAGLAKLRFTPDARTQITLTDVAQSYWENKTGNGDGDYLPLDTALARGNALLAANGSAGCAPGEFKTTNSYSVGGQTPGCQTPQQYASLNAGWQGAGPAWHSFDLWYDDAALRQTFGPGEVRFDAFTTRYQDTQYRENLPFRHAIGDTAKTTFESVTTSGSSFSYDVDARGNDVEGGLTYLNDMYRYRTTRPTSAAESDPSGNERAFFVRDVFHPEHSPLTVFTNLWARHAGVTGSAFTDARISALDRLDSRNVVRLAIGSTTTVPTPDQLSQPFTAGALAEGTLQGAGGGQSYVCGGLNAIGSGAPSLEASLVPERGTDLEGAYAHSWTNGSTAALQLYDENVFNKLYPTIVPLARTGTAFLPPGALANANAALTSVCGAGNYQLGVTQTLNIGTLRASGADVSGRWQLARRLFADLDWDLTSTVLVNAPPGLLASNLTFIPGSQLPRVPLHTFDGSLDATFHGGFNARYTLHTISANNTKSLPAYDYSDLRLAYPLGERAALTLTVTNLFNQYANIAGLIGEGVPLALNGDANAASYTPLLGTDATERYGLPYRQLYLSYAVRL